MPLQRWSRNGPRTPAHKAVDQSACLPIRQIEKGRGSTYVDAARLELVALPGELLPERVRVVRRDRVLPDDDRVVDGARVGDDARDVHANAVALGEEDRRVRGLLVDRPRVLLDEVGRLAARGDGQEELVPAADVDERVRQPGLLDELPDGGFLREDVRFTDGCSSRGCGRGDGALGGDVPSRRLGKGGVWGIYLYQNGVYSI